MKPCTHQFPLEIIPGATIADLSCTLGVTSVLNCGTALFLQLLFASRTDTIVPITQSDALIAIPVRTTWLNLWDKSRQKYNGTHLCAWLFAGLVRCEIC
jgi:hypothetical protein